MIAELILCIGYAVQDIPQSVIFMNPDLYEVRPVASGNLTYLAVFFAESVPAWLVTTMNFFSIFCTIFYFIWLVLFIFLCMSFFRTYAPASYIWMVVLCAIIPVLTGFLIFAFRNRDPIDYDKYMQERMERIRRAQQAQYGPYGGSESVRSEPVRAKSLRAEPVRNPLRSERLRRSGCAEGTGRPVRRILFLPVLKQQRRRQGNAGRRPVRRVFGRKFRRKQKQLTCVSAGGGALRRLPAYSVKRVRDVLFTGVDKYPRVCYNFCGKRSIEMISDIIAAVSTPPGRGGVAVVRLSGAGALGIAEKIFAPSGRTPVRGFEPYRMYPGSADCGAFRDFGLCVYFKAPHSFTGEDVVEFHCHGGTAITRGILKRAVSLGARLAERGEFTKRAFLNGKLSLASAEGLVDMINGESDAQVRAGYMLYSERLTGKVRTLQGELTEILAGIDADIDFPEEDIEHTDLKDVHEKIDHIAGELAALSATYGVGKKVKEGVSVVLAGRPNTGKSSVLNALLGADKAIVSSVAGTTRDVVEGSVEIGGVRFNLYDTAGIRENAGEVESIGIGRARSLIEGADLVLFILDSSAPFTAEDAAVYAAVSGKKRLVVYNKTDLSDLGAGDAAVPADIRVSAKTGENIPLLREKMFELCLEGYDSDAQFLIEERHYNALSRAEGEMRQALELCGSVPLDLLGIHLKAAWEALGEISGETANEAIIDEIFAKFCVGK